MRLSGSCKSSMKKLNKKMAVSLAACGLLGSLAVSGTMAYLTDGDKVINNFTVGDIKIETLEPNYPGNDSESVRNMVPNEEVAKDPQVKNTGVNDAIVFVEVQVPVRDISYVRENGSVSPRDLTELFWFKDEADTQGTFANHWSDKWTDLSDSKGEVGVTDGSLTTYVFAYSTPIAKGEVTEPLFDKIQLKNFVEDEVMPGEAQSVVVKTYAIQATDILLEGTDLTDLTDGKLSKSNLEDIYEIYLKQNEVTV